MFQEVVNRYQELANAVRKINRFYVREGQIDPITKDYLLSRGLDEDTCGLFGIGYSPTFSRTLEFLELNGILYQDLIDAGVFVQNEGGIYDRFSGRITFSLEDPFGKGVGFSGRIFTKQQEEQDFAKYVNSASSAIFQKSFLLYNLHKASVHIKNQNYAILVEGMMDVITFWQNGVYNVIAPCGTSLTEEQCKLLKIFTNNVIICYDSDEGGIKSLPRIITLFTNAKMQTFPLNLPTGEDPDSFIKKYTVQPILSVISSHHFA